MFGPKLWAIDLGRSAVKGVLITPARDGVEILDADIIPLKGEPSPESLKEPSRDMRLWEALTLFEKKHDLHKGRVALAIAAQNTLVRDIKIAMVGKRKLQELIDYEASNAIPFVLDEVLWDYHLFDAEGDETTREGVIFAVKKTSIHTYLHALSQAHVDRVVEITLAPLAALSFMRFEMGGEGRAMVLDIGAENTSMIAMNGPRFWIRSLQGGGNRITRMLAEQFEIPFDQAEEAKHNIARSEYAEDLLEAIKPGLHELMAGLKTNLDYFERIGKQTEFDRIYAIGGGANLIGLKAQIRRSLGRDLHDIRSLEHIFVSPDANVRMIQKNLDRFAVAIGTGIRALEKGIPDVSFVPVATARIASASRTKRCLLGAGVIVWAILLTLYFFMGEQLVHLRAASGAYQPVDLHYVKNQTALKLAEQRSAVEGELAYLNSLGRTRDQAPLILHEVVRHFSRASKSSGDCSFVLQSFHCATGPPVLDLDVKKRPAARKEPGKSLPGADAVSESDLYVAVRGRLYLEPGVETEKAYGLLRRWLLNPLRASPVLARSIGKAAFADSADKVTGNGTRWAEVVQPEDQIMAQRDGEWYKVKEVVSDTELVLSHPFGGGDIEGDYTISRVSAPEWNHVKLEFTIVAVVPQRAGDARREEAPVTSDSPYE